MARNVCVFCGVSGKNTAEHLFPNWINKVLTPADLGPGTSYTKSSTDAAGTSTANSWPSIAGATATARIVCGACNGGWMSDLESTVIPILTGPILGHSAVLRTDHQLDVATWACLKAMVFEYAWPDPPVFTQADREVLMTQLRPPASVQIRLAAIESQGQPLLAFRRIYRAASGPLAICTTIVVGCVVVQVFGGPGAGEHGFRKAGGAASGTFVGIFPPTFPDAAWPPAQALDDTTIEAFAHPMSAVVD